jgi:hypothetical protein
MLICFVIFWPHAAAAAAAGAARCHQLLVSWRPPGGDQLPLAGGQGSQARVHGSSRQAHARAGATGGQQGRRHSSWPPASRMHITMG